MKYITNKYLNALLGILNFAVAFIIQDLLEYFTALNMDSNWINIGTFVFIYVIIHFATKMLVYKYRES